MNRRLLYPTLLPMAAFVALSLAACTRHAPNSVQPANSATSSCLPSHDGYLRVRLRGARDLDVDWHDADLECEGGERPGQGGLRLAFMLLSLGLCQPVFLGVVLAGCWRRAT